MREQGEGRYHYEGLLDDGPDTRLFLATDRRLERIVTLLYYKPTAPGAPQLAVPPDFRAKHEALTLAKIVHPGVARIHLIEEEQSRPALVMESLLGTLAEPIAYGLTAHVDAAAGLLYRMADALRAAADAGHCHHRLLPNRVGLTPHHEPKLMGFGHQRPSDFLPGLRGVEAAFLAPEVRVLSADADQRSDVFSLGVLTYALLAGCYPMVPRRRGVVPPVTKFRPDVPALGLGPKGARPWEELDEVLVEADVVITGTAAPLPVITRERFRPLLKRRRNRPLFLIDLAVPRDVEPEVGELHDVYLYNIDDLNAALVRGAGTPRAADGVRRTGRTGGP